MNNSEVGHEWFYNTDKNTGDKGAANHFYNGDTIYSYGGHYPIARKIDIKGEVVVLMTIDAAYYGTSYGQTTARHCSLTRQAIPGYAKVFFVENPVAKDKKEHKWNYDNLLEQIKGILKAISTGRNGSYAQQSRIDTVHTIVEQLNAYTHFFKLGKRMIDVEKFFDPEELAKTKIRETRIAKRLAKEKKERQARIEREKAQAIEEWKAGQRNHLPWDIGTCYLRIKENTVQTSKGASIGLDHALLLFKYVNRVMRGNDFSVKHFGHYRLTRVERCGDITIGCHKIEYAEMARVYNQLTLTENSEV